MWYKVEKNIEFFYEKVLFCKEFFYLNYNKKIINVI